MRTILIVDDEVDVTSVLTLLFEFEGFQVLTAHNGADALKILDDHTPDLIISDCMMPVMDGVRFLHGVRGRSTFDAVPFVLMSGEPGRHNLVGAKFDIFLRKPFQFDELMTAVRPLLGLDS